MKPIILKVEITPQHLQGLRSLRTGRRRNKTQATSQAMRAHLYQIISTELSRLQLNEGRQQCIL